MASGLEPDHLFIDEIHQIDESFFEKWNEDREKVERSGNFRRTIVSLERLNASPFCGMTGRQGVYRADAHVMYASGYPPVRVSRKFSCREVADECREWGRFLVEAIAVGRKGPRGPEPLALAQVAEHFVPAPQPRLFSDVTIVPGLAVEKPRWIKAKGGARGIRR